MNNNKFLQLKKANIRNIVIYVSDSLRWDFTPKEIKKMGITCKTIAASLYTASSFPSIFSGLYPPRHGVYTWENYLEERYRTLLNLEGYNASLRCETTWTEMEEDDSQIHRICGNPEGESLKDVKEPFVYVEDDKGGHCPYGVDFNEENKDCSSFFEELSKEGKEVLRKRYKKSVKKSIENFKSRLDTLSERGLKENTLIIFTSDHGELLGEYGGLVSHGRPSCPELVYVPTIFIHPDIDQKVTDQVISHIDFLPTILDLLNKEADYNTDGINITKDSRRYGLCFRKGGYTEKEKWIKKMFSYGTQSIWDANGGHVFHTLNNLKGYILFLYKMFINRSKEFTYLRGRNQSKNFFEKINNYFESLNALTKMEITYGTPKMPVEEGKAVIERYIKEKESQVRKLEHKTRERLEALGYID